MMIASYKPTKCFEITAEYVATTGRMCDVGTLPRERDCPEPILQGEPITPSLVVTNICEEHGIPYFREKVKEPGYEKGQIIMAILFSTKFAGFVKLLDAPIIYSGILMAIDKNHVF
jgi:hypothetical protein